jgi:hypothetical protein
LVFGGLAADIALETQWTGYADWCVARGNWELAAAAEAAARFVETALHWSFEERRRFSLWLVNSAGAVYDTFGRSRFKARFSTGGPGLFAPTVVIDAVVRPTLQAWRDEEPGNAEPRFWLGLYGKTPWQDLREAVRLDPAHGPARAALGWLTLDAVEYNQHELPLFYIGDPARDLADLAEAEALVAQCGEEALRTSLEPKLSDLRRVAADWIERGGDVRG